MSAIGKGDWVECVKVGGDRGFPLAAGDMIVVGGLYQVRAIIPGVFADGSSGEGLLLRGVTSFTPNGREGAWAVDLFRPVYRPRADFIQSLKAPPINAPARVGEVA